MGRQGCGLLTCRLPTVRVRKIVVGARNSEVVELVQWTDSTQRPRNTIPLPRNSWTTRKWNHQIPRLQQSRQQGSQFRSCALWVQGSAQRQDEAGPQKLQRKPDQHQMLQSVLKARFVPSHLGHLGLGQKKITEYSHWPFLEVLSPRQSPECSMVCDEAAPREGEELTQTAQETFDRRLVR